MEESFARKFGDALAKFLQDHDISESEAARKMKIERGTLNTYTHDSRKGKRPLPSAEILAKACTALEFEFEYEGFIITALRDGKRHRQEDQLNLEFTREFDLAGDSVAVGLRRPPGRVELSISLKAVS
jgi:transcriptional regulator with XRE-family HTH domain